MNTMPDSNTAALDKYEADELLRSYVDDACERNMRIKQWREDRTAELRADPKALTSHIFLQCDGGELTEALLAIIVGDKAFSNAALLRVVDSYIERVLDAEEQLLEFR